MDESNLKAFNDYLDTYSIISRKRALMILNNKQIEMIGLLNKLNYVKYNAKTFYSRMTDIDFDLLRIEYLKSMLSKNNLEAQIIKILNINPIVPQMDLRKYLNLTSNSDIVGLYVTLSNLVHHEIIYKQRLGHQVYVSLKPMKVIRVNNKKTVIWE